MRKGESRISGFRAEFMYVHFMDKISRGNMDDILDKDKGKKEPSYVLARIIK